MKKTNNIIAARKCEICHSLFIPSKYNLRQRVCKIAKCIRKQKINYAKKWRKRNPSYSENRKTKNREACRLWRLRNPIYYREYRIAHPELKIKNNRYVREFRRRKKESWEIVSKNIALL